MHEAGGASTSIGSIFWPTIRDASTRRKRSRYQFIRTTCLSPTPEQRQFVVIPRQTRAAGRVSSTGSANDRRKHERERNRGTSEPCDHSYDHRKENYRPCTRNTVSWICFYAYITQTAVQSIPDPDCIPLPDTCAKAKASAQADSLCGPKQFVYFPQKNLNLKSTPPPPKKNHDLRFFGPAISTGLLGAFPVSGSVVFALLQVRNKPNSCRPIGLWHSGLPRKY